MKRSLAVFALAVSLSTSASAFAADDAEVGKLVTSLTGDDAQARKDAAKSLEALNADSVERLRLTGVPEWRVVFRHALPAAVIPCLSAMALYAAAMVSGIVVVEMVFSIPGLGQELVRGVVRREVHVVQAIALASALIVVTLNLAADLAILALDPRARTD